MANPQINELVVALLKSPRGAIAVTAVLGSIVAFLYMFMLKGNGSNSKRSGSNSKRKQQSGGKTPSPKKSSPAKKSSASPSPAKSSPVKKEAPPRRAKKVEAGATEESPKVAGKGNSKSTKQQQHDKKELKQRRSQGSKTDVASGTSKKAANSRQASAGKQQGSSQTKSQNDDGEWITVAKKKPRASLGKKTTGDEEPVASRSPQTRSSTRRSNPPRASKAAI